MNNLFAREKSYRTNFFLEFKNPKTESKFRADLHSHAIYALVGFLVLSILIIMAQFMDSTCFRYSTNCKLEYLTIFTMLATMGSLILIHKNQSLHLIRMLMLILSIYMHLSILDRFEYTAALLLVVIQTTISTSLVFDCWKYHLIYNTLSYLILFWGINFYDMRQFYRKDFNEIAQDFAIFHLLATAGVAFLERSSREKWAMMDSLRRSGKVFQRLFEEASLPIILIDGNKNLIMSNRKGIELIAKVDKRLVVADVVKGIPSPSLNLIQRINFTNLIDSDYQAAVAVALEGLTAETKSKIRVAFKKPKDVSSSARFDKSEVSLTQASMAGSLTNSIKNKTWEDYGPIYDMELSDFIWKGRRSYLLTFQDVGVSIKNQDLLVHRLNKVINDLEDSIFNLEQDYDKMMTQLKKGDFSSNIFQPVSKLLLNLNTLKSSIMNTHSLNCYLNNFVRQQFSQSEFNLKQFTVYLLEILSLQSVQNKVEMNLSFGNAFPEYVSSDPSVFQQIFGNLIKGVLRNTQNSTVDIICDVRNVLAGGVMLLEFKIEVDRNEVLNANSLKEVVNYLMNDHYENMYSKLLNPNEMGIEFGLLPIILKDTEGGIEISEGNRVSIVLIVPMPHYLPEDSQSLEQMSDLLSKVNLTNTRSMIAPSKYSWKREMLPEIKILPKATEGPDELVSTHTVSGQFFSRETMSSRPEKVSKERDAVPKADRPLTFAEFQEKKKQGDAFSSPIPAKRATDKSKIKDTMQGLIGFISTLPGKPNLPGIREEQEESPPSATGLLKLGGTGENAKKPPQPSLFKRQPSRTSKNSNGFMGDSLRALESPESFKLTNKIVHPSFDEQLVKTIIIFCLIELLSKQPPPNARKTITLSEQDSSESDNVKSPFDTSPIHKYGFHLLLIQFNSFITL